MRAPSQRRALGTLFALLFLAFAGIAWAAAVAGVWPVAVPAAVLSVWIGLLSVSALRRSRRSA